MSQYQHPEALRSEGYSLAQMLREKVHGQLTGNLSRRAEQKVFGQIAEFGPLDLEHFQLLLAEPGIVNIDQLVGELQQLETQLTPEEREVADEFSQRVSAQLQAQPEVAIPESHQFVIRGKESRTLRRVNQLIFTMLVVVSLQFGILPGKKVEAAAIPTPTALSTETPKPTGTPEPTEQTVAQALPTVTPTPRPTVAPTSTAEAMATPTPTATVEATPTPEIVKYAVVKSDGTNIRPDASTAGEAIGQAIAGEKFELTGKSKKDALGYTWYEIYFIKDLTSVKRHTFGWLRGDVITISAETRIPVLIGVGGSVEEPVEQEVTANPTVTTTEEITVTESEPITATETISGQGNVDQLLETAQAVNSEVSQVKMGENNPVALDKTGFPIAEYKNGVWENSQILAAAEFQNNVDIKGKERFEELPKETAYAREDGTFAVLKLDAALHNQARFSVTDLGVYVSQPLAEGKVMVMEWEELEYRADWKIPQFEGEHVTVSISSAFNDVHPNREVILQGKKQYLFEIHNGTVEEGLASQARKDVYLDNQNAIAWYQQGDFLKKDETPIAETNEYDESIKLDNLINAFWQILSSRQKDGKVLFPKLKGEADVAKRVEITIWRFPDDDEGKLGWYEDAVSPLPSHFYQINDNGQLIIHMTLSRTGSHNMSATIAGAFGNILQDEFDIPPDWMDMTKPIYSDINNSIVDLVELPNQNSRKLIVLPIYIIAGEDADLTWNNDN